TINLRGDTAGVGAGTGGIFVRPNAVIGVPVGLPQSQRTTAQWFNTAAFTLPPSAAFGNLGRSTVIGPSFVNLDFVAARDFPLRENVKLQFRAEFFNVLNHPNYNLVGRIINDPATFGKVLSQFDPRQIQFGLKLTF